MIEVTVINKHQETDNVCLLELAKPDGLALPAFSAGAHIDLHLPGGLIRQYSLCNTPSNSHSYEIGVLLDPDSRGGSITAHKLNPGDTLTISEPRNLFPLEHNAKHHLLIAAGIGITPILCMAERLSHQGANFDLHYSSKIPEQTAFVERIKGSAFSDKVAFHFSQIEDSGRINAEKVLAKPQPSTHLYVCGPNPFMDHILKTARTLGWPQEQLHREYFAAEEVSHNSNTAFEVRIASSGDVLEIPADKTVLDVLMANEIDIPFACAEGICGTCVTRVLEGDPDHRDLFLTDEEKASNEEFAPCCSRAKSKRLVLDI